MIIIAIMILSIFLFIYAALPKPRRRHSIRAGSDRGLHPVLPLYRDQVRHGGQQPSHGGSFYPQRHDDELLPSVPDRK